MANADVSAIIVNYNSGPYTVCLVECLLAEQVTRPDGTRGQLEILVVENSSPQDQSEWLDPIEKQGVTVLRTSANLGYGGGCNFGTRHASGRNLLYLNPDVLIAPGGVDILSRYLDAHPHVGQVGPRGWFDSYRFFHLPRIELPSLSVHLAEAWRRTSKKRAEAFALRRSRHALRIWSATAPQEEPVLAGYGFMLPGKLARELGPFDEDYPLYFEDSDLTRRIRAGGYLCMLVPEAEMVHLYNKSAGQFAEESQRKAEISQGIYWRKHYGRIGAWIGRQASRWMSKNATKYDAHLFADPDDLGDLHDPPTFAVPNDGARYVFELTPDPMFTLAVGRFDNVAELTIPPGVWEHLDPSRFFVRALRLPDLTCLGAWTFHKRSPVLPVVTYPDFLQRIEHAAEPMGIDP